jgi:hypothetical protein
MFCRIRQTSVWPVVVCDLHHVGGRVQRWLRRFCFLCNRTRSWQCRLCRPLLFARHSDFLLRIRHADDFCVLRSSEEVVEGERPLRASKGVRVQQIDGVRKMVGARNEHEVAVDVW